MIDIENARLTDVQMEEIDSLKDEMSRKHGEYVVEVIDNTITRLRYHALRYEKTASIPTSWLLENLKLINAVFQVARSRGISLLPSSIVHGPNNESVPNRIIEGYLESPVELKQGVIVTDEEYLKIGFIIVEYLISRYYSLSRIHGTYRIYVHSISFDLDICDPNKPLAPHAMLRIEHYKI